MGFGLSDHGEELHYDGGFVGEDLDVTIYLDNTDIDGDGTKEGDDLADSDGLSAVTTEPSITRKTISIASGDITQFSGDYGFEKSASLDVDGITGKVDGVLLIDADTSKIVARAAIQSPEPGPYQSLDGLKTIELKPRLTTD